MCFTWARQWLHLASLFCRGLLCHHDTPATPCPQSGPDFALVPVVGTAGLRQAFVDPTQDPTSHFEDGCFRAKLGGNLLHIIKWRKGNREECARLFKVEFGHFMVRENFETLLPTKIKIFMLADWPPLSGYTLLPPLKTTDS